MVRELTHAPRMHQFPSTTRFYCMIIAETNPISLCSHPHQHPNFDHPVSATPTAFACANRSIPVRFAIARHGTAAESESARGRFEPVAMAMLRLDGSLAMFAPEGDGCLQRAKREDAGRFSKEGKSLDDFWYFSSLKSTIREQYF